MSRPVTLGIAGFGVVGSGTVELLRKQQRDVEALVGAPVRVKWLLSRSPKHSPFFSASLRQTRRWQNLVRDPEVDCVVELMGGLNPARNMILAALEAGKHVVTANKAVLAKHWSEIFERSHRLRRVVYFEAAVGGGIPVVQALDEGLAGNQIHRIVGILNGTTNFILTRMQEAGDDYAAALKAAQAAGFAEANPAFDVQGIDAAQKISILGSLATGTWIQPERVFCEGITRLSSVDLLLIQRHLHSVVKLLAIAENTPRGWVFRVHPTLVPSSHPFANVRNEYNAIALHGSAVGDLTLVGKGAGRMPTSSAVVSDIIFLCRQIANGTAGKLPSVSQLHHRSVRFAPFGEIRSRYYLRITTKDAPGVLSRITGILGQNRVSIASVHQETFDAVSRRRAVPILLLTHRTREADVQTSVQEINALSTTLGKTVVLRRE